MRAHLRDGADILGRHAAVHLAAAGSTGARAAGRDLHRLQLPLQRGNLRLLLVHPVLLLRVRFRLRSRQGWSRQLLKDNICAEYCCDCNWGARWVHSAQGQKGLSPSGQACTASGILGKAGQ